MLLAYDRFQGNEEIIVVFNRSDSKQTIQVPVRGDGTFEDLLSEKHSSILSEGKQIALNLNPVSGIVLRKKL
jgi:glycosidase